MSSYQQTLAGRERQHLHRHDRATPDAATRACRVCESYVVVAEGIEFGHDERCVHRADADVGTRPAPSPPTPAAHLDPNPPADQHSATQLPADTDRQWYCRECGSRVTCSPDGALEYGHWQACPHAVSRNRGGVGEE